MPEESLSKARASALRLLKIRPRTEAELRRRLLHKGFAEPIQDGVLEELKQKGLVDDAKFARLYVAQTIHSKPMGRLGLKTQLRLRGISGDVAAEAVASGAQDQDEMETARRLAAQRLDRLKGLQASVVERRLFGFLSRRGFSSDVVYKVVREMARAGHSSTSSP